MSAKDAWEKEISSVRPLPGRPKTRPLSSAAKSAPPQAKAAELPRAPSPPLRQERFDPGLYEKLARGKIPLDARIDLHGLTEDAAFRLLEERLAALYAGGRRRVLVITGKGRGGAGRMKAMLPRWLSSARFLPLVSSLAEAAPKHGGAGAFYALLRKAEAP
ncbi:MAG TPA: Smr/MutS family protein [Sphingomonadales bacterium]|nr:Smr/MutS family protein [Sphingomonadales bacterium]